MTIQVSFRTGSGQVGDFVDRVPDKCPSCHFAITPINLQVGAQFRVDGWPWIECVYSCPNDKCQRAFLARYSRTKQAGQTYFQLDSCAPTEIRLEPQSDTISLISPDFCAIYEQANKAEQNGLMLVAGPGYRKALEFLIKDYVIGQLSRTDPEILAAERAAVEKTLLGVCIARYVKSEQIKEIGKRAAWLGNDETHYVRKWEDKDLKDLKKLIFLTLHWIEMEKLTADVIEDMPEGKT